VIQEEYVSHKVKEELLKYNIKTYIEYSIEKGMFSVSRTYMYPTFVMTGNN
jgi:hypothetical protein